MPVNDTCAAAILISGYGGTVTGDNSVDTGAWDTGNDPVFNWGHWSGGRPRYWKWTNGDAVPRNLKVTPATGKPIQGGIIFGPCGSLDLDLSGAHSQFSPAFFSGSGGGDLVVQPGDTVFIEIEALPSFPVDSSETTEPPTSSDPIYGTFSFDWSVREMTPKYNVDGEVLVDPVSGVTSGGGFPLSGIRALEGFDFGGAPMLFFAYEVDLALYAGVCNVDGSGLVTSYIAGGSGVHWSGIGPDVASNQPCVVFTGEAVYLGFGVSFFTGNADDSCAGSAGMKCGGVDESFTADTARKYAYQIFRFDPGSSTFYPFSEIIETIASDGPQQGVAELAPMTTRMCASPNDRGNLWIYFGQSLKRETKEIRHSNYPTADIVGLSNAGCDRCYVVTEDAHTYADVYQLTDAGGAATLVSRDHASVNMRALVSFDPDANWFISPGSEVVYADGPWLTAPSGTYTTTHRDRVSLVDDEGYPIMVSSVPAYWNDSGQVDSDEIEVTRLDTGATLASFTYGDLTGTSDPTALVLPEELLAGGRYYNLETSQVERFLSIGWVRSGTGEWWVHTVKSDFSTDPVFLIAGDATSSQTPGFLEGAFRDSLFDWWGHDPDESILQYDHCAGAWVTARDLSVDSEAGTELGPQNGAWVERALYLIAQGNRIHRFPITDADVCTVTPLGVGLFSWQRF